MAKPGEHTYAPITCARTNPTFPPPHCPLSTHSSSAGTPSLCIASAIPVLTLSSLSALSTWHLACWHFYWLWHLLVLPTVCSPRPSSAPVPFPFVSQLAFPVAVVFLQPESWLRMSAVPCWGPFPAILCLSLCVRLCGRTRCHIAHTPSGTNWTWAHAGTA